MNQKKRVAVEDEFFYVDKLSGERREFTASERELVTTFLPESSAKAVSDLLAATPDSVGLGQTVNRTRGFTVVQVANAAESEAVSDEFLGLHDALNTLPVLTDADGLARYFLPDEFTVQFVAGTGPDVAEALIQATGCSILVRQRTPGYYTLAVPEGQGLFTTIRAFLELEEILFAEPSEAGFDDDLAIPGDPLFGRLWGLRNTGQQIGGTSGEPGADISVTSAWNVSVGARDVVVAVIDTGADIEHPDLAANILPRNGEDWNFAQDDDMSPTDAGTHGTHVAGTVAAVGNLAGVVGVAPGISVMPLRINLQAGMNQNRADAINYVATRARDNPTRRYVVNCSWRMSGNHAAVHHAIKSAVAADVVVVFAAGNADRDMDVTPAYPAIYPEVIAVAATDQRDRRASFSNYGAAITVSAPGVKILSTVPGGGYEYKNGTSMAAPHVAGLAALVVSIDRHLSVSDVRKVIEDTADSIDSQNGAFVGRLGAGRVNAERAVKAVAP